MHSAVKKNSQVILFLCCFVEKYQDLKGDRKHCAMLKVVKFYIAHKAGRRLNSNCSCSKRTVLYYGYSFLVKQIPAPLFKQDVSFILVGPLAMLK